MTWLASILTVDRLDRTCYRHVLHARSINDDESNDVSDKKGPALLWEHHTEFNVLTDNHDNTLKWISYRTRHHTVLTRAKQQLIKCTNDVRLTNENRMHIYMWFFRIVHCIQMLFSLSTMISRCDHKYNIESYSTLNHATYVRPCEKTMIHVSRQECVRMIAYVTWSMLTVNSLLLFY
jgi:hypothetical protein